MKGIQWHEADPTRRDPAQRGAFWAGYRSTAPDLAAAGHYTSSEIVILTPAEARERRPREYRKEWARGNLDAMRPEDRIPVPAPQRMLTFPARPMNGGQLEHATAKVGRWYAEPKANGYRTLVHGPSSTMWNRHGQLLSIAHEFPKALQEIKASPVASWFDCEGLERRHGHGRGTLLVIDLPELDLPYEERKARLTAEFCPLLGGCHADMVYSVPAFTDAPGVYAECKSENRHTFAGAEFYEGIVMKKHGSPYPRQLLRADRETPDWIKHRWKF